jgi:hypothetical protein
MDAGLLPWAIRMSQREQRPSASRPRTPVAKPAPLEPRTHSCFAFSILLAKSNVREQSARQARKDKVSAVLTLRACHAPCWSSAALPLRSGQRQSQLTNSFGLAMLVGLRTRPVPASSLH